MLWSPSRVRRPQTPRPSATGSRGSPARSSRQEAKGMLRQAVQRPWGLRRSLPAPSCIRRARRCPPRRRLSVRVQWPSKRPPILRRMNLRVVLSAYAGAGRLSSAGCSTSGRRWRWRHEAGADARCVEGDEVDIGADADGIAVEWHCVVSQQRVGIRLSQVAKSGGRIQ